MDMERIKEEDPDDHPDGMAIFTQFKQILVLYNNFLT